MPELTKRSFTSGEISPSLHDRVDITNYATGLEQCLNFFVKPQGGVANRAGFSFVGGLLDNTKKGKLIEFQFNSDQTYALVFEHLKLRIIQNGGFVLDSQNNIYEIDTPYTEDEVQDLYDAQSADVMTLVHPNHQNRNLVRLANDNWQLSVIDYAAPDITPEWGSNATINIIGAEFFPPANDGDGHSVRFTTDVPHGLTQGQYISLDLEPGVDDGNFNTYSWTFYNPGPNNDGFYSAVVVAPDAFLISSQQITISSTDTPQQFTAGTLSTGVLTTAGDVASAGDFTKSYSYRVSAVVNGVESLPSLPRQITTQSLSTTYGVSLAWSIIQDADYYRVYKESGEGTGVYGWVGDSETGAFIDFNIAPITSDSPVVDNLPFEDGNNPSTVGYYQQRQIFANTNNNPQTFYASKTADYNSFRFSRPSRDDDSITVTLASNKLNEIRHIVALNYLVILTSGGEWLVTEGQDEVLTPSTTGIRIQSYNGSSKVKPEIINDTVVYVQQKGSRLRNLGYEFSSDSYTGSNLSIMSEHLFDGHTITDMAFASEPHGILWCVRDDGILLGLTYQKEHAVIGWHRHITDGEFESVATVTENNQDVLYAIVKRQVNGETVRYVERLNSRFVDDAKEGIFLDSSLTYRGTPVNTVTGLDHLEGKVVTALADGNVISDLTVTNGSVSFEFDAEIIHVGLMYDQFIDTLDIDSNSETLKSDNVSIPRVYVSFNKSRGGFVSSKIDNNSYLQDYEIKPRFQSDNYDSIQLKSYVGEVIVESNWSKSGGVRISQKHPLPMEILSITPEFEIAKG